jgi:BNR repeat protein
VAPSFHQNFRRCVPALLLVVIFSPAILAAITNPSSLPTTKAGDQWELGVAADGAGHIYVLYPQYGPIASCNSCLLPALTLVVSSDSGSTWQSPRQLTPPGADQFEPQVAVDPIDHRTVYAAWLENSKKDIVLSKSVDFGQSWSLVIADRGTTEADKPALAVRGQNVLLGFSRAGRMRAASSHDGGITFSAAEVDSVLHLPGLTGGATIGVHGSLYLTWSGYLRARTLKGYVNLYLSQSADGGATWSTALMDTSSARSDCSTYHCMWGYAGAQITVASDEAGTIYALWNSGPVDRERVYFTTSTTAGETWMQKAEVSTAPAGTKHAWPMIATSSAGNVRIAWVDSRHSPLWNAYYRTSTNGGATWSEEREIPALVPSYRFTANVVRMQPLFRH